MYSKEFLEFIKLYEMKVNDMELIKSNIINEPIVGGIFSISLSKNNSYKNVIELLRKSEGICRIEEV